MGKFKSEKCKLILSTVGEASASTAGRGQNLAGSCLGSLPLPGFCGPGPRLWREPAASQGTYGRQ